MEYTNKELQDFLANLPHAQFADLMRRVFEVKTPASEEITYNKSRFYLATASSRLNDDGRTWGEWKSEAIGYVDKSEYPDGLGPDYGFSQSCECTSCKTRVRSNVKHAICPICSEKVYCT